MRFLPVLLLALATQADGPHDLSGLYAVTGRDAGGVEYAGTVHIAHTGADTYAVLTSTLIRHDDHIGVFQGAGVGLQDGTSLSVSWHDGKRSGVTVYKLGAKGKNLTGRWTTFPGGKVRTEELRWLSHLPRVD